MKNESVKTPQSEKKKPLLSLVYPFNWQGLENFVYPLDTKGIPQVHAGKHLGLRYNPVTIAQYGLFHLQKYAQNREEGVLQIVRTTVDWLVDNIQLRRHEIGAWLFDYDLEFYGPKAPWLSGMAQGQGISLLLRAHQIIEKACLLEISKQAYRAFLYSVAEGGVVSHFPDGSLVFEEFPTHPSSLVLNGHIFTLLGIYDYSVFWQDKSAQELFELACIGLKKNLARYDTGYWNLYDLHPSHRLASPMYVKVHVQLLHILADLIDEPFFQMMANKWRKYLTNPICRFKWLVGKATEKIRLRS